LEVDTCGFAEKQRLPVARLKNLGTLGKNVVIAFWMVELVKISGLITRHMCSALEIRFPVLTLSSSAVQQCGAALRPARYLP
jgi:hypothetical protein